MSRLQAQLRKCEDGLRVSRLNGRDTHYRDSYAREVAITADLQARYDHLAGVPPVNEGKETE